MGASCEQNFQGEALVVGVSRDAAEEGEDAANEGTQWEGGARLAAFLPLEHRASPSPQKRGIGRGTSPSLCFQHHHGMLLCCWSWPWCPVTSWGCSIRSGHKGIKQDSWEGKQEEFSPKLSARRLRCLQTPRVPLPFFLCLLLFITLVGFF